MRDYLSTDPKRILLLGDTHADTNWAMQMIARAAAQGADLIIQVGDFGYWPTHPWGRKFVPVLTRVLARHDMVLWFVDGNHEDHARLEALPLDADGLRPLSDRIVHLPRGFRWTWGDTRWLAIGGAVSLDRQDRKPGKTWFANEAPTTDQVLAIASAGPADVVVAHEAPWGVHDDGYLIGHNSGQPTPEGFWDADALASAGGYRRALRTVLDEVRPHAWFHGHHHRRHTETLASSHGNVEVTGLACDGSSFADSTVMVNTHGRREA